VPSQTGGSEECGLAKWHRKEEPCRAAFVLTDVPFGGVSPVVSHVCFIRVEVGCQRAKCRGGDRDLYSTKSDVPVDVVFDNQCSRIVTGKEGPQCIEMTEPGQR
jgi:hypothetical protein